MTETLWNGHVYQITCHTLFQPHNFIFKLHHDKQILQAFYHVTIPQILGYLSNCGKLMHCVHGVLYNSQFVNIMLAATDNCTAKVYWIVHYVIWDHLLNVLKELWKKESVMAHKQEKILLKIRSVQVLNNVHVLKYGHISHLWPGIVLDKTQIS